MSHTSIPFSSRLLACGVVAGPLFTGLTVLQSLLREDHDLRRDPVSLLSLGDLGWVQIANFVLTGLLVLAFAVGLRRADEGTWGPVLVGTTGCALVVSGVFVADTIGAPITWPGAVHDVASAVAINAGLAACLVLAFRLSRIGRRGLAVYSALTAVAGILLGWCRDPGTMGTRHTAVAVLLTVWVALVALEMLRRPPRSV